MKTPVDPAILGVRGAKCATVDRASLLIDWNFSDEMGTKITVSSRR